MKIVLNQVHNIQDDRPQSAYANSNIVAHQRKINIRNSAHKSLCISAAMSTHQTPTHKSNFPFTCRSTSANWRESLRLQSIYVYIWHKDITHRANQMHRVKAGYWMVMKIKQPQPTLRGTCDIMRNTIVFSFFLLKPLRLN